MSNKLSSDDLVRLAEQNKGYTNEENELKNVFLNHASDDSLDRIFNLGDENNKYFTICPKNTDIKMRILGGEELLYAEELYYKYISDLLDGNYVTEKHQNLCRLIYHSSIIICISACDEAVERGETLQEISKKSKISFGTAKKAPFPAISFILNIIDSENRKFNPQFAELEEEEVKELVNAIKKQELQLSDLSYLTCISILKQLIEED